MILSLFRKVASALLAVGVALAVSLQPRVPKRDMPAPPAMPESVDAVAKRIDDLFEKQWREARVDVPPSASDLTIARRLSLALVGAIPAFEDLRQLQELGSPSRLAEYTDLLLEDTRHDAYFAERLARMMVPSLPAEMFISYRRNRFVSWLTEQLRADRPYGEIVRELITAEGLWTDTPAVNFISSHDCDPEKLAIRTSRAFLSVRLDCAQCHDHPFAHWKQRDFQGLAAYYGQAKISFLGVSDGDNEYTVDNEDPLTAHLALPKPPLYPTLDPTSGTRRERLAAWLTHAENRAFARSIAHRVWVLMFGKGMVEPIDDLEKPQVIPGVIDLLADDFTAHGESIDRMIRVLARTKAFRTGSPFEFTDQPQSEDLFALYPLTRLRPEQIARSLMSVTSLRRPREEDHWLFQLINFTQARDLIQSYGDNPDDEWEPRSGNLPQRLLLLNGSIPEERIKPGLYSAISRIAQIAPSDRDAVRLAYQVCLVRSPTETELAHFMDQLAGTQGDERADVMVDLFWTLTNSTEFSWNF